MVDKVVIINGKTLVHGTGVKETIEKNSAESTICFDEAIIDGSDTVSYKLTIDRIVFETRKNYEKLRDVFKKMMKTPGTITTREVIRYKNSAPFVIVKNYSGVILDGKDYEMKPEQRSVQNLSFLCADMDEYTEDYTE
jgi:hypothetical protein